MDSRNNNLIPVFESTNKIAELDALNAFSEAIISAASISDLLNSLSDFTSQPNRHTALTCAVIGMFGERLREMGNESTLSKKFFDNLNDLIPNSKVVKK